MKQFPHYIFSVFGFQEELKEAARRGDVTRVSLDDMYQ